MVFKCLSTIALAYFLLVNCLSFSFEKKSEEIEVIPMKIDLKLRKTDSLQTVTEFDIIPGSEHFIANLSAITYDENSIFLTDFVQNQVFSLNRESLYYERTFGKGKGKGPGDLNNPVNTIIYHDSIVIEESQGANLYSYFLKDGSFIKSVRRKNFSDLNISFDRSFFLRDRYIYKTVGYASDYIKIKRYDIEQPDATGIPMVSLKDFGPYLDTSKIASTHPYMFVLPSKLDTSHFYAASGSKLQVNMYNMDGTFTSSFDLSGVKELSNYCRQIETIFSQGSMVKDKDITLTTYFNGIAIDDHDRLIYPCLNIKNMNDVLRDIRNPNVMEAEYSFVVINLKDATYDLLKCKQNVTPMKVIDNNLWCYDRLTSKIVVYELPV